jgi:hypothetical protein
MLGGLLQAIPTDPSLLHKKIRKIAAALLLQDLQSNSVSVTWLSGYLFACLSH